MNQPRHVRVLGLAMEMKFGDVVGAVVVLVLVVRGVVVGVG